MSKSLLILLVSLLSIGISTPSWGQDSTYRMSVRQQDSLIRLSEGLKTLRELFNASIKDADTYKTLWQSEKDNRAKDKADQKIIIDGYAAIDQGLRNEITALNKKYKGQVRKNRVLFILFVAASSFGIYQTLK